MPIGTKNIPTDLLIPCDNLKKIYNIIVFWKKNYNKQSFENADRHFQALLEMMKISK